MTSNNKTIDYLTNLILDDYIITAEGEGDERPTTFPAN